MDTISLRQLLTGAGILGLLTALPATAADAAPPSKPSASVTVSAANELSARASAYLAAHPWKAFTRMEVNQTTNTLTLLGSTAPPSGLRNEIQRFRTTSRVVYRRTPYSDTELTAEARRLLKSSPRLGSARPNDTGTGLVVTPRTPGTKVASGLATKVPITVEQPAAARATEWLGRDDDTQPFYGGSLIMNPAMTSACSAGFPVFYGSAPNRQYGMVTAAHCGEQWFRTKSNKVVGRTHIITSAADAQMLIGGGTAGSQPYSKNVFFGAWDSTNSHTVRNGGNPAVGAVLCASGAVTGERCDLVVYKVNTPLDSETGSGPAFWIRNQTATACAGQHGDSGGPIYFPSYSDNSVTIAGMIRGGIDDSSTCPGNPDWKDIAANGNRLVGVRISTVLSELSSSGGVSVGLVTNSTGTSGGHG